jgi:hypothetical protein
MENPTRGTKWRCYKDRHPEQIALTIVVEQYRIADQRFGKKGIGLVEQLPNASQAKLFIVGIGVAGADGGGGRSSGAGAAVEHWRSPIKLALIVKINLQLAST